jgi:hypothetical protein
MRLERLTAAREPETITAGPVVTHHDVLAFVGWSVTDIDYIINPFQFCDPDDGGAPAEVYAHPRLLRAWALELHPRWVCDGESCRKLHPDVRPGVRCDGRTHEINARNRLRREIAHKIRAVDPKRRWTPAETLSYLREGTIP